MSSSGVAVEEDTASGWDSTVIDEAVQLMADSQGSPSAVSIRKGPKLRDLLSPNEGVIHSGN